ncbi:uncharacterized protein Z518_07955 [Rhinocladiella mackenziei CBS 650.93]|uniref:J domain-containing protein n=1 Tax=Rhinocladiella mackenziei CBS 650.93 TaxID=1442369 RepID=A0A0D2IFJ0_9EURO|nr:uncharacterized protein Z518_07955 [Rhinocladiella mackenziei CBS 650.93]KIX02016.1 hypothetical protein Z518_07955 [Rhinocladiella mackenziei CBS 650.93]
MSSPIPPDPYATLGVSKDADHSAIRTAHRKLVLKCHPDRIKDETLREKGKDEFQKIQQAYEILSDPVRRSRYDDQVKLAELRKEAMARGPPPTNTATATRVYPMRPAPQPSPTATREYREDGNFYEEVRAPKNTPAYDYRDPYEETPRTTSRKHPEYEKRAPPPSKTNEKSKKASSTWAGMMTAAAAASKLKAQAEKARSSKADEKRSDREKKRERSEKVQTRRAAYVDDSDSDYDYPEIRPSYKPSSRPKTTSHFESSESTRRPSHPEKYRDWDEESFDEKWERHHEESKAYMAKANNRPSLDRVESDAYHYWGGGDSRGSGRRSGGSDNERRPTSSKGRRSHPEDYFTTPPFSKSASSPTNLRAHVEERAPNIRDRDRERDRERERRMPPNLHRSQTTPVPKATSKMDTAPPKGSNLKHGETHMHDSGYGSSSSPHTPEMREESPPRTVRSRQTSTRYQIVDPEPDGEDQYRSPRVKVYDDYHDRHHRRYHHSPESIVGEPNREFDRRKEKPERPRVETNSRSKSSRGTSMAQEYVTSPGVRRGDSGRFEDGASPRSPRETPPVSRNNSGREREKLYGEMSPDEREPSRYARRYSADKIHMAPHREPQYASYPRDPMDYRSHEPSSRFREPRVRRPSVSVGGY